MPTRYRALEVIATALCHALELALRSELEAQGLASLPEDWREKLHATVHLWFADEDLPSLRDLQSHVESRPAELLSIASALTASVTDPRETL